MLNIKGAFVVIGEAQPPLAVILADTAYGLYMDRCAVVGFTKATRYTFGHTADYALPCSSECMEFIALNYQGPRQDEVRQLCARIALGQPVGDGKEYGDGGQHARIDAPIPNPKSPAGIIRQAEVTS